MKKKSPANSWVQRQMPNRDDLLVEAIMHEPTVQEIVTMLENGINGELESDTLEGQDSSLSVRGLLQIRRLRAAIRMIQANA